MNQRLDKILKKVTVGVVIFSIILILLSITYPSVFTIVKNLIWVTIFSVAMLFFTVGVLTVIGRKKEASKVIDLILEGSVSMIDIMDLLSIFYKTFLESMKKVAATVIPYFAYVLSIFIYFGILALYKYVGSLKDVAILTIVLTIILTITVGFLNRPKAVQNTIKFNEYFNNILKNFRKYFVDSFEITIFILFLTIDSTNLSFLPSELNVPINATISNYNLIYRGFSADHVDITVKLVGIGLFVESLRMALKLGATALKVYNTTPLNGSLNAQEASVQKRKQVIRKTVHKSKGNIMRFASFTTFMMFVFMFFPRLKLVALITASTTNLFLDVVIPGRLTFTQSTDLISRIFNKVVRVDLEN